MGRARCTLKVRGLDCAVEVAALRSALENAPGVGTLGFDLIHGMMTVDYDPEATEPAALVRRITTRAGMRAELAGAPEVSGGWWSRNGRWASTAASGLALLAGVLIGWWGWSTSATVAYALAVVAGGLDLLPRAARSLRHFRLDIHVLMGSAVLGAIALGQWDEAATVAFLFGLSELLEALSVDRARRAVRALLEVAPESAERIEPDGSIAAVPASEINQGDRVRVRSGERVPVDGSVVPGPVERRPEGDHRRVGAGPPRGGRRGLRRLGQRRGGAGGRGVGDARRLLDLAGRRPGPRGPGGPGAGRADGRAVREPGTRRWWCSSRWS